jgi:hypothetical protein
LRGGRLADAPKVGERGGVGAAPPSGSRWARALPPRS